MRQLLMCQCVMDISKMVFAHALGCATREQQRRQATRDLPTFESVNDLNKHQDSGRSVKAQEVAPKADSEAPSSFF